MQITLLITLFAIYIQIPFQLICSQNETIVVENSLLPNIQNNQYLEILHNVTFSKNGYEFLYFGHTLTQKDQHFIIYQKQEEFLFQIGYLKFQSEINTVNMSLVVSQEFQFNFSMNNTTLLKAYVSHNWAFIVFLKGLPSQQQYLLYKFGIEVNNTKVTITYVIPKHQDCQFYLGINQDDKLFYFAQYDCYDWSIQVYKNTYEIELLQQYFYQDFNLILKSITLSQSIIHSQITKVILHFDYAIYQLDMNNNIKQIIFSINDRKILFVQIYHDKLIAIIQQNNIAFDKKVTDIFILIRKEAPKKALFQDNTILLLYNTQIEHIVGFNLILQYNLVLDDIYMFASQYLVGIVNKDYILIKKGDLDLLFNCTDYQQTKKTPLLLVKNLYFNFFHNFIFETQIYFYDKKNQIQIINEFQLDLQLQAHDYLSQILVKLPLQILGPPVTLGYQEQNQEISNFKLTLQQQIVSYCLSIDMKLVYWFKFIKVSSMNMGLFMFLLRNQTLIIKDCEQELIKFTKFENVSISDVFINQNKCIIIKNNRKDIFFFRIINQVIQKQIIRFNQSIKRVEINRQGFQLFLKDCSSFIYDGFDNLNQFYEEVTDNDCKIRLQNNDFITIFDSFLLYEVNNIVSKLYIQNALHVIAFDKNQFVVIHKVQKQKEDPTKISIIKYRLYNLQLYPLYEMPIYNMQLQYIYPVKYQVEGTLIAVATQNILTNDIYVLVYDIQLTYSKSLIECIQIDCEFCFLLSNTKEVVYLFQQQIYIKTINHFILGIQIQPFKQFLHEFNLTVKAISKVDNQIYNETVIKFTIKNCIYGLILNEMEILLSGKRILQFDPRSYVVGPIQNITSSQISINQCIQEFSDNRQCTKYISAICINENDQTLSFDFQKNDLIPYILLDQLEIFRFEEKIYLINNMFDIYQVNIIQEENKEIYLTFNIDKSICSFVKQVISFHEFLFLECNTKILIYQIYENNQTLLFQFMNSFDNLRIISIKNLTNSFLLYSSVNSVQYYIMIIQDQGTIQINNLTSLFLQYQDSIFQNYYFNFIQQIKSLYNKQIQITGISLIENFCGQVYELLFDLDLTSVNMKQLGHLRIPYNNTIFQSIISLSNEVIIFNDIFQKDYNLLIYNISEAEKYLMIDPIGIVNSQCQNIQIYNQSTFLCISQKNMFYTVNSYLLNFTNSTAQFYELNIRNQISNATLRIQYLEQDYQEYNKIIQIGFFSILVLISLLIILKKLKNKNRQSTKNNFVQGKFVEIEM